MPHAKPRRKGNKTEAEAMAAADKGEAQGKQKRITPTSTLTEVRSLLVDIEKVLCYPEQCKKRDALRSTHPDEDSSDAGADGDDEAMVTFVWLAEMPSVAGVVAKPAAVDEDVAVEITLGEAPTLLLSAVGAAAVAVDDALPAEAPDVSEGLALVVGLSNAVTSTEVDSDTRLVVVSDAVKDGEGVPDGVEESVVSPVVEV